MGTRSGQKTKATTPAEISVPNHINAAKESRRIRRQASEQQDEKKVIELLRRCSG